MQFTIATIALFSSTALALPTPAAPSATISFINDQTGASAAIPAPLDGSTINLYRRLAGSPIGRQNQILASSAQFTQFPQNAACIISGISTTTIGELNARRTWTKLNPLNQPGVALVDLNGATMRCTATGTPKREVPFGAIISEDDANVNVEPEEPAHSGFIDVATPDDVNSDDETDGISRRQEPAPVASVGTDSDDTDPNDFDVVFVDYDPATGDITPDADA